MKYDLISLEEISKWNKAIESLNYSIGHSWKYNEALSQANATGKIYLYSAQVGLEKLIIPIQERVYDGVKDICTPYGFSGFLYSGKWIDFKELWYQSAKELGYVAGYIGLHPFISSQDLKERLISTRDVYALDLEPSEDELYKNLQGKGKKSEVKWPEGCKLIESQDLLKSLFYEMYSNSMVRVGASRQYFFSQKAIESFFDIDGSQAYGIEHQGVVQAICLFLKAPLCTEYFLSASSDDGRPLTTALLWKSLLKLKSEGVKRVNLGGGVVDGDGLAKFKARFGAQEVKYIALKQIYNMNLYTELCLKNGAEPESTGYFPAYYKR